MVQRVLKISPGASHAVLLMCHLLATTGQQDDAAAVAAKAAAASGMSTESLSLWSLLTEQQALTAATAAAVGRLPSSAHEHAHGRTAVADMNRSVHSDMVAEPEQAAAAAEVDDDGGEGEGVSDEAGDAAVVHNYVTACEEVLAADPWALGAVEGEQHNMCLKPNILLCHAHL